VTAQRQRAVLLHACVQILDGAGLEGSYTYLLGS